MDRIALTRSAMGSLVIFSFFLRAFFPGLVATPIPARPLPPATAASPPPLSESSSTDDGPWRASQSFFAGWGPCADATKSAGNERNWCIPSSGVTVKALIAIAPDPVRTQMSLIFDRTLEGIQLAAQDSGYSPDRYWLPWRVQANTDGKNADSDDPRTRQARAGQPGLILFRKNPSTVLFVFVVSDTATAGIDGTQFRNAVTYLDAVCPPADCGDGQPTRIVGPSFSGSLNSLVHLTDAFLNRPFTVYSGSVSSLCAMADQGLLPQLKDPASVTHDNEKEDEQARQQLIHCGVDLTAYTQRAEPVFKTFVHDTDSTLDWFVTRSADRSGSCTEPRIAMLSESATAFGASMHADADHSPCIVNYVYPREIATLRNAGRAAADNTAASGGTSAAAPVPDQLPLDLTDRTNSSDAPPDFSVVQSPLSKESVLMNMAAGMRRAHYQYIGVSGSNVLDVLFLTKFLRAASPDSRLFVVSSDLLFERELDDAPYIGMVAVTTFPLIEGLRTQPENDTTPQRQPFADEYEEGEYHAALATLNELLGTPLQPFEQQLAGTGAKPLWMTVVGAGGYWPIRILEPEATPPQSALTRDDLLGAWIVLLILTSGVAALQAVVLLTASPFAARFRDFALVSAVPRQRLFYIQVACATVALALAFLLLPAWWHTKTSTLIVAKIFGTAALAAVIGAALLLEALYVYRWRWARQRNATAHKDVETETNPDTSKRTLLLQLLTCLGVWALAAGLFAAWWRLLGADPNAPDSWYGFFFAYRAVHMGSGVSPLTPLFPLLIAVYAWACFEIWRLRFNDDMRPRLTPEASTRDESSRPRPGQFIEKSIADAINRYSLQAGYAVPFATVFVIWLAFFHPTNPFQVFERTSFMVLYEVLFSLVVALMLSSGFRMAQIWIQLRQLLVELERRPIRAAFSGFKDMSWSFWRQGGEDAEWAPMVRSLEAVAKIETGGRPRESGLPDLAYFRDQIQAFVHDADRIHARLVAGATPRAVQDDLERLERGVGTLQRTLASGSPNLFLRSAIDDARTCVKSLLAFNKEPPPDAAAARTLVELLGSRLRAALDVIELAEASARAQDATRTIWSVWQSTQKDRPVLSVVESLKEYGQVVDHRDRRANGAAMDEPRVSRFYDLEIRFRSLQNALAEVLGKAWDVVEGRQEKELAALADPEDRHKLEGTDRGKLTQESRELNALEHFIALRYVTFIRGVLGHLRHVMIFLALSFSLALTSLNIYSFEPHQSLIWSFTLIFVVTGAMVVGVLMQLHRDPILSRVTGTSGNTLDLHFYLRIVAFGSVPLLTLLATHYPALGRYLVSFLQPSLEALK